MDAINAANGLASANGAGLQNVGYGFSLNDVSRFDAAMTRAQAASPATSAAEVSSASSESLRVMMMPLEQITNQAQKLASSADKMKVAGTDLKPGDLLSLTVQYQEFMFHCQLTSNIANRASDGLQQIVRQQS